MSRLSQLQRDVLELEAISWDLPGQKIAEFRRRHPHITETGYYMALNRLLADPAAYEYDDRRYAALLTRLASSADRAVSHRFSARTGDATS
jgi:hypothetical protein